MCVSFSDSRSDLVLVVVSSSSWKELSVRWPKGPCTDVGGEGILECVTVLVSHAR